MNLVDFEKYGERIAVVTETGQEYCYRNIFEMQKRIAGNIEKESLVCIITQNDMGSLLGYFACIINDAVPILLSAQTQKKDIHKMLDNYMPEYLWFSKEQNDYAENQGYTQIFTFLNYQLWERGQKSKRKLHPELALLLPTSGSTGNPKFVRLSKENIIANTKSICQYLKLTKEERAVSSLPLNYTYGLSVIHTFLHVGASVYLTSESVCQKSFWTAVKKYHITFFAGVPYTYECMKKMGIREKTLEPITKLTQAGGKLSEEQQMFWGEFAQKTKKKFYIMYGQTEATARIGYLPPEYCLKKIGSVGIPIPGCQLQIVDSNGITIRIPHKTGEIVCKGRNICMGYAEGRSDLALGDENKGTLHTGDLGYRDEEGFLYISGRKSRFAKVYGERIDLAYLESRLEHELGIQAVLLSDDNKIYLYTSDSQIKNAAEYLQRNTGFHAGVLKGKDIAELPRNEFGKIRYH